MSECRPFATAYRKRLLAAALAFGAVALGALICRGAPDDDRAAAPPDLSPGETAFRKGDYTEAARLLREEFAADPQAVRPGILLARAQMRLGNAVAAESAARVVLKRSPDRPEAVLLLGQSLEEQTKWAEALPLLERSIKGKAKPRNRTRVGRCLYYLGRTREAYEAFKTAADDFPTNPVNHYFLGRIDAERGYWARGERHLNRAREFASTERDLLVLLARAAAGQARWLGTVQELPMEGIAEKGKDAVGAIVDKGLVIRVDSPAAGRMLVAPTDSAAWYAKVWLDAPGNVPGEVDDEPYLILSRAFLVAGDADRAQRYLDECAGEVLQSTRGVALAIDIAIARGEFDRALERTGTALNDKTIMPDKAADLFYRVALGHLERGKFGEADEAAKAILAIDPHSAPALRLKGRLALATGRPADARTAFQRLIEAHPDAPDAERIRTTLRILGQEEGR